MKKKKTKEKAVIIVMENFVFYSLKTKKRRKAIENILSWIFEHLFL